MRLLLLLTGLLFSFQVFALDLDAKQAMISPGHDVIDLTPHILILRDPQHRLKLSQILSPVAQSQFKPLQQSGNSIGFDESVYWIQFSFKIDELVSDDLLLNFEYPLIDDLTLYAVNQDGRYQQQHQVGDNYPFSQREISFRSLLFKLHQIAGTTQTYYIRLQTQGSMQIPLSVWTTPAFIEYVDLSSMAYGVYYGIMVLLMLASAVAYLQLRQFLLMSYAVYLLSFLFLQVTLNGFGFQYIWPDHGAWSNPITTFAAGMVLVAGLIFSGTFLRVWQQHSFVTYIFNLLVGLGLLSMLLSLFGKFTLAVQVAAGGGIMFSPIVIVASVNALMAGYQPARFFLLAWSAFLVGVFVSGLVYYGVIERNFVTYNAMQIGSLIEILILGYVLMVNVRKLNSEKQSAIVTANHLLEQLNEGLEAKVAERTQELFEKNKLLSDLALRDSMTGLLNHNTSIDYLKVMISTAQRYGHQLSVVMMDIDHFKVINDEFGHPAGDKVLCHIADLLNNSIRQSDSCGRYGGEEFILLLPETAGENALEIAETIRRKVMKLQIPEIDIRRVTASFGVAEFDPAKPGEDLIRDADIALYEAKENGRNQSVLRAASANCSQAI